MAECSPPAGSRTTPAFGPLTYDLVDAVIVNFGYSEAIKYAVGRERPNGENNQSFPSGHASNAFTIATVAEQHYGWKLGVPAYRHRGRRRGLARTSRTSTT